jgi:hypothetical protein
MKTAVLIPSHIHYQDQLMRLEACLSSICSQTIVPDIFVSISFANNIYKREFNTIIRKYPTVKFKLSAQQKFQMEHLFVLSLLVGEYDIVMFCDDDDTYLQMRVEKFIEAFEFVKLESSKTGKQFGGVREVKSVTDIDEYPEYWAYGIPPLLLNQFFERVKGYEDLMQHKFADMYFRNYLRESGGISIEFGLIVPFSGLTMYQYTTDNPNSICMSNERQPQSREAANTIIQDNITLSLICNRDDLIQEQLEQASAKMSQLNKIVPNCKRIKCLTNILYR